MKYRELFDILKTVGKDPSRLIFEDDLTGINNRRFLLSFFEHKIRWDSAEDFPISLLMLDVDHFKETNDRHGHDAGDQVLQWLSSMMKQVGGERYVPIRYGGGGGGGGRVRAARPGSRRERGQGASRTVAAARQRASVPASRRQDDLAHQPQHWGHLRARRRL